MSNKPSRAEVNRRIRALEAKSIRTPNKLSADYAAGVAAKQAGQSSAPAQNVAFCDSLKTQAPDTDTLQRLTDWTTGWHDEHIRITDIDLKARGIIS